MDPLSITLGVLSLLGTAIKSISLIHDQIKICRSFCREINRIEISWRMQCYRFDDEVGRLVRVVVRDSDTVYMMLRDPTHSNWSNETFARTLHRALGDSFEIWQNTAGVIKEQLEHFEGMLRPIASHIRRSNQVR
jgi:hypothetical protein